MKKELPREKKTQFDDRYFGRKKSSTSTQKMGNCDAAEYQLQIMFTCKVDFIMIDMQACYLGIK